MHRASSAPSLQSTPPDTSADGRRSKQISAFVVVFVTLTLISGCGADQVESVSAPGDGVATTSDVTADAMTTTPDITSAPCTPAPTTDTATTATTATAVQTTTTTPTSTETEPATSPTTPSTAASSSTTTPSDPQLAAQQQRLADLGYWLGPVDGRFGSMTAHAVTAFQKAEGLPRTGQLDADTADRLAIAATPPAQSDSGAVLEIDLSRQILLIAVDGRVTRIYDIATGASATPTPPGRFTIYTQIDGYRHAPLGTLYRPKYFNGGIALHGYTSVPTQPASHGCVRLTYPAMDDLWASGAAPIGTPVWVY